ncbi:MAG: DnaD domain protein, partial [Clostridiales Family XIII bacterium]|jgi:DNA replication protein DnaD|nr:DnaD domain protein [Clostridiales Family XIII bacterium]
MHFKKEKSIKFYLMGDTHIENIFINEMMAFAPGDYVKVYLFALMYAELGMEISNSDIGKHLGMAAEDVLKAWTYWEGEGAVRKHYENPEDRLRYDVEFINLKSMLYGKRKQSGDSRKKAAQALPPNVSALLSDTKLQELCREVEGTVGCPISPEIIKETVSWVTDLGVPEPVVAYAYRYAARKPERRGKANAMMAYARKLVRSWTEKGLDTVSAVEAYLEENDLRRNQYRRVMKALGMNRSPSEAEQRIMDGWFDGLSVDIDTVLSACGKTSGINSPNINYVDAVLQGWAKNGARAGGGAVREPAAKKQIAAVNKIYEKLREKAESDADARREEVYARVPEIKRLDAAIMRQSMEISKTMLSGAGNAAQRVTAMRKQLEGMKSEKAFLMTENNFAVDYMDIAYSCGICKDTGTTDKGERCACFAGHLASI